VLGKVHWACKHTWGPLAPALGVRVECVYHVCLQGGRGQPLAPVWCNQYAWLRPACAPALGLCESQQGFGASPVRAWSGL
jgi:hypothetical protein